MSINLIGANNFIKTLPLTLTIATYKYSSFNESSLSVFLETISIWALKNNYKIVEIAGDEPKRIGGEKKMRIIYNGFCILRMIKRAIFL